MTALIMREHIQHMPEQQYKEMRELDEAVGRILGWQIIPGGNGGDLWAQKPVKDFDGMLRDDSNELADDHETDTGLPFFSYSMNGAQRVLNWVAKQDAVTRKLFYEELQARASSNTHVNTWKGADGTILRSHDYNTGSLVAWPDCLTTLIPEFPKNICEALLALDARGQERDARRTAIDHSKAGTNQAPWVSTTNDSRSVKSPTEALKEAIEKKQWFGICPLNNGAIALKIDDTEYIIGNFYSEQITAMLHDAAKDWEIPF